jgi:hypothetical protein
MLIRAVTIIREDEEYKAVKKYLKYYPKNYTSYTAFIARRALTP